MSENDVIEEFYIRIREPDVLQKFEEIQDEVDERTDRYSDQKAGLAAIKLAHQKLEDYNDIDQDLEQAIDV